MSWIEEVLLDPRVQAGIVGILLIVAALPAVTPIRYRLHSSAPFVGVEWEEEERPPAPTRTVLPRREAYSMEPLMAESEPRPDGLDVALAGGVARDSQGNLYVSDSAAHRVYRIAPGGDRHVVAGTGSAGFSGDGGAAAGAALDTPRGLAIDAEDNLFIADTGNNRVRRVNARGIIRTIAGTDAAAAPQASMARYADADKAPLLSPISLQHDRDGSVFVTESACATGGRKPTVWVLKQKM